MDRVLREFQKGILERSEAISELRKAVDGEDAREVLANSLALALRNCSLRDQTVQRSFGLLFEFGLKREKEGSQSFSGFSKLLVEDLLLQGVSARDLAVRVNSLRGLSIALRIIGNEDLDALGVDGDGLSQALFQVASRDKSQVARGVAISCLGQIPGGKDHLVRVALGSQSHRERARSLSSIQLRFLAEGDVNSLLSRMLDESSKVRRAFYRSLLRNLEDFAGLMPEVISWSHVVIICQFGLNDRDLSVRNACLNFVLEFVGRRFGGGTFGPAAFVSFLDQMVEFISAEDSFDITAANLEVLTELLIPSIFGRNRRRVGEFFEGLFLGEENKDESPDSSSRERPVLISELRPSKVLSIRVMAENYGKELCLDGDSRFAMERLILSISRCSSNSFLIRQILLIVACIDLSDPGVRETARALALNCLKYTPFDDSTELLESELIPLESMVRSSEGGEWVAYFLHRSVIWASLKLLEACLDEDELLEAVRKTIEEILNPKEESGEGSEAELSTYRMEELAGWLDSQADVAESDKAFQHLREMVGERWMRILFVLEAALSVLTHVEGRDSAYWTECILKQSTRFFVRHSSRDQGIPQILLARCTALITIIQERSSSVASEDEDDNLVFFVHGLDNALRELLSQEEVSNGPAISNPSCLYVSVQCEVYVSSIVDILVIRLMKRRGVLELGSEALRGLQSIWQLACGSVLCTHRLSSISLRGVSRILLCLREEDNRSSQISIEILTSLLYLVYMTDTLDEFSVLVEPQGLVSRESRRAPPEVPSSALELFQVDPLICLRDLAKSSGDKQMLVYLFSTYATISFCHLRNFTVSLYRLLEKVCSAVGVTAWGSYHAKSASKLLLFGTLLLRQAADHLGDVSAESGVASYPNLYGLLSLYLIAQRFPKHIKRLDLERVLSHVCLPLAAGLKDQTPQGLECTVLRLVLKSPKFSGLVGSLLPHIPAPKSDAELKSDLELALDLRDELLKDVLRQVGRHALQEEPGVAKTCVGRTRGRGKRDNCSDENINLCN